MFFWISAPDPPTWRGPARLAQNHRDEPPGPAPQM